MRFWVIVIVFTVLLDGIIGVLLPFLALPAALAGIWLGGSIGLRTQLYCRYCTRRITMPDHSGVVLVCPHCHRPTDAGIAAGVH